jgi:Leucine Rich repeat
MFKHMLDYRVKLTHLSLDGNEIGDEICKELCIFITKMGSLSVLNISKCAITCLGAKEIAKVLDNK